MVIEKATVKDELELESLFKRNPEQIERGLRVLGSQIRTPPTDSKIDLLCVDSEGVITVIELKLESDEHQMEQIMMYYDWALSNLDWIKNAYPKYQIKDERPRLILIAKSFPERVITLAKYVNEAVTKVDLYTYSAIKVEDKKEVVCTEYRLPQVPEIKEKPKTPEEIIGYIKDDKIKSVCKKVLEDIKNIDSQNIEEGTTKYSIVFKYKGRNICSIDPRRDSFVIGWRDATGEWKWQTGITSYEQAKELIEEEIKNSYKNLKKSR